jgi:hypothetical protein
MVQRCEGYTYEQEDLRGRVGEERRGKKMGRCPLTVVSIIMADEGAGVGGCGHQR